MIFAGVGLTLWLIPEPEAAWRAAVRLTARSSAVLLLLALLAESINRCWPSPFSHWALQNRRYIGLSFAASHTIHAYTFLSLASLSAQLAQAILTPSGLVIGAFGYGIIAVLVATSNDRAQQLLGRIWWGRLHGVGVHLLCLQFLLGFLKHAPEHPEDWAFAVLLLGALGLRWGVRRVRVSA